MLESYREKDVVFSYFASRFGSSKYIEGYHQLTPNSVKYSLEYPGVPIFFIFCLKASGNVPQIERNQGDWLEPIWETILSTNRRTKAKAAENHMYMF